MRSLLLPLVLLTCVLYSEIFGQKEIYEMIGENVSQVIRTFGKPQHHDKSNPEMECLFYQTKTYRIAFVANGSGVYQAEKCIFCSGKKNARQQFENVLKKCRDCGMKTDSLDTHKYEITGKNVRADLSLFENTFSKNFEVRIIVHSKEG